MKRKRLFGSIGGYYLTDYEGMETMDGVSYHTFICKNNKTLFLVENDGNGGTPVVTSWCAPELKNSSSMEIINLAKKELYSIVEKLRGLTPEKEAYVHKLSCEGDIFEFIVDSLVDLHSLVSAYNKTVKQFKTPKDFSVLILFGYNNYRDNKGLYYDLTTLSTCVPYKEGVTMDRLEQKYRKDAVKHEVKYGPLVGLVLLNKGFTWDLSVEDFHSIYEV